jgi:hypothetical protein
VHFLTWLIRTWFLTRTKSLSLLTLISLVFVNRKSTRTLLILSTESIKSLSRQWSGHHPRGRISSWSTGSSSTVFSQRRSLRPLSRKCWSSSLSLTTFTCTLLLPPVSTNEATPLRMRSLTLIASYCHIPGLVEVRVFHPTPPPVPTLNSVVDSADFGRSHVNGSVERRLRLANSSPNVKALFDNSPATYSYSIDDDDDSTYMTPQSDYWHPLPPPIVCFGICSHPVQLLITSLKGVWNPWSCETPGRCDQARV